MNKTPSRPWNNDPLASLSCTLPCSGLIADLKSQPDDFVVDEVMSFEPGGEGEHLWLWVEKTGSNTDFIAKRLSRLAGVSRRDVSYSGMKDRHAVTRQWFSIHLLNREEPDWRHIESDQLKILRAERHHRKLRRGAHRGNRFTITLHNIAKEDDCLSEDPVYDILDNRLNQLASRGVPNYFGTQRFGSKGSNLDSAADMLATSASIPRHQRSLYLSAMRSWLFNRVLSQRVAEGSWDEYVSGDVCMLAHNGACFVPDEADAAETGHCRERMQNHELHPAGPIHGTVGKFSLVAEGAALELEHQALQGCGQWMEGLENMGLELGRRSLRLLVEDLQWSWNDDSTLRLSFELTSGGFATMVLRELVEVTDKSLPVY